MTTASSAPSDSPERTASIGPSLHLTMMSQSETDSSFQSILSVAHSYKEPILHHSSSPPPPGSRKAFTSPTLLAPQPLGQIDDPLGLLELRRPFNSATEANEHVQDRVPSERTDQSYFPTALLPAFPVSDPDRLTSIAILSTTIWKRLAPVLPTADKVKGTHRPGTSPSAIGFGFGKASILPPIWTYHRMVLTHFKMHDVMPSQSIRGSAKHQRQLSTQTVAHLHLFTMQSYPSAMPSRPSTSSSIPQFGSVNKKRPGTSQGLQSTLEKIESERRMIDGTTTVGIWDEATGPDLKRKNVLRIGFGSEQTGKQTWYCSFADTWVCVCNTV
ncbi:hypothetical protein BCR39DRAFT_537551 [Naematelia encephala]|uniref:Uncharacterized protein n=1 Tax=Naematelia encephala TaxID=71784 RepID=A0A1Y2AYS2_9TREE|nr:hypothetical protein BCR39DRAFT_537551 [Naematelia encephala]